MLASSCLTTVLAFIFYLVLTYRLLQRSPMPDPFLALWFLCANLFFISLFICFQTFVYILTFEFCLVPHYFYKPITPAFQSVSPKYLVPSLLVCWWWLHPTCFVAGLPWNQFPGFISLCWLMNRSPWDSWTIFES